MKATAELKPQKPTPELEMPSAGGSYLRNPDGSLTQTEATTQPDAGAAPAAATEPAAAPD